MSVKRVIISLPVFFLTVVTGLLFSAGGATVSSTAAPVVLNDENTECPWREKEKKENDIPFSYDYADGTFLLDPGPVPKAFRNVEYLRISMFDLEGTEGNKGFPIPPTGLLKAETDFKFTHVAIGSGQVTFQTETVNGIAYRFKGYFPPEGYKVGYGIVLSGELIKIRNGKPIASMTTEFW